MTEKIRRLLPLMVILVILTISCGITTAFFTDYEDAHGGAVLKLDGETEIHETPEDDKKTVSIKNIGETDVIVRVGIYGDYITFDADEKDWVRDGNFWYYRHILEPGKSTSDIIATIDVTAAKEAEHDFEIVVVHESERVVYDGSTDNKIIRPEGWPYPDIAAGMEEEVSD